MSLSRNILNERGIKGLMSLLPILLLGFSCSDSSSGDYSLMTFKVETIHNYSIEEFADNFGGAIFPITIILEDYDPESDFSGTVNTSKIGLSSITRSCLGDFNCFIVDLDSSYFPIEFLVFNDLIIDNSEMKGQFAVGGSTIDTPSFKFIASRKE